MSAVDEKSRKVSFRAPSCSFYITVPEKLGTEEWVKISIQCLLAMVSDHVTSSS